MKRAAGPRQEPPAKVKQMQSIASSAQNYPKDPYLLPLPLLPFQCKEILGLVSHTLTAPAHPEG